MKIAYLILAHENFAQLERLIKAIIFPSCDIYVHIDKKSNFNNSIAAASNIKFMKVHKIRHGGFNMVEATITLMKTASMKSRYDHYILLSESDYPIKSTEYILNFLKNKDRQFLSFFYNKMDMRHRRYKRYHYWDFPLFEKYIKLRKYLPARKIPFGMQPYFGSQWWILTHDCVRYVLNFVNEAQLYRKFFRFTQFPSEMFFHTIIMNSRFKNNVIEDDFRYIDWSLGGGSPKILDHSDIKKISSSDCLFARKFDSRSHPDILDVIDKLRID